jgi:hypothetical protein
VHVFGDEPVVALTTLLGVEGPETVAELTDVLGAWMSAAVEVAGPNEMALTNVANAIATRRRVRRCRAGDGRRRPTVENMVTSSFFRGAAMYDLQRDGVNWESWTSSFKPC